MVGEKPILFQGWKIRTILDWDFNAQGDMQTRRVVKPQPESAFCGPWTPGKEGFYENARGVAIQQHANPELIFCPYGKLGDRLWVRESFMVVYGDHRKKHVYYNATNQKAGIWKPSIHMPRWASRILLEVTDVRVERVQEITGADAKAEGAAPMDIMPERLSNPEFADDQEYVWGFEALWDSINAKRGYPWADEDLPENMKTGRGRVLCGNPWVWVVLFKRIKP